jgi:Flp pilus assembly pilin Flp
VCHSDAIIRIKKSHLIEMIKQFFKDESGTSLAEYAILASLIAIGVIVTVAVIGYKLDELYESFLLEFEKHTS